MSDNIYEATNKYILKYDKYDLDIKNSRIKELDFKFKGEVE